MLYYLLGAALSALPSHRCKGASCAEYAAQKLRVALRYNPNNEEAKHALSALVADPSITTASNAYIKSPFDEYAATFDKALLQGLNYSAPFSSTHLTPPNILPRYTSCVRCPS